MLVLWKNCKYLNFQVFFPHRDGVSVHDVDLLHALQGIS